MGISTTRKSLTTLMTLAETRCACSLIQSCGWKESVHAAEIGLAKLASPQGLQAERAWGHLLALKDHDQCIRYISTCHKDDAKDDDVAQRFTATSHDFAREKEHRNLDKGNGLTEDDLSC